MNWKVWETGWKGISINVNSKISKGFIETKNSYSRFDRPLDYMLDLQSPDGAIVTYEWQLRPQGPKVWQPNLMWPPLWPTTDPPTLPWQARVMGASAKGPWWAPTTRGLGAPSPTTPLGPSGSTCPPNPTNPTRWACPAHSHMLQQSPTGARLHSPAPSNASNTGPKQQCRRNCGLSLFFLMFAPPGVLVAIPTYYYTWKNVNFSTNHFLHRDIDKYWDGGSKPSQGPVEFSKGHNSHWPQFRCSQQNLCTKIGANENWLNILCGPMRVLPPFWCRLEAQVLKITNGNAPLSAWILIGMN